MVKYTLRPRCEDWRVSSESSEKKYSYRKKSAAISMAKSLVSAEDTIAVYRFDGEFQRHIE
ncbi:MAG: hypothetical protein J07HQW1_02842 [Haloquadratum walsbyi J07HQW1]|jgi:hypothetical protein|uniref:DUF2188 domain-containing protein n=1 Tax=Haloquadratum walsbyi J07HQW1 TaxID=1238424 RepID=U1MRP2_9EURY|nr:MAG: hypothetical protein J07HQW1_02842 [Haloquadratum walsbyi J07HQW1]